MSEPFPFNEEACKQAVMNLDKAVALVAASRIDHQFLTTSIQIFAALVERQFPKPADNEVIPSGIEKKKK